VKQLDSAFVPILVSFIISSFSVQNAVSQITPRNWDAVKDSLLNDEGIVMPEMPDSFLSTEQFLERGKCNFKLIKTETTDANLAYREVCRVTEDSVIIDRVRFFDVRAESPTKVIMVVAYSFLVDDFPVTCDLWANEGFWNGGDPNDNFTDVIKDNPCGRGENLKEFKRLLKELALH